MGGRGGSLCNAMVVVRARGFIYRSDEGSVDGGFGFSPRWTIMIRRPATGPLLLTLKHLRHSSFSLLSPKAETFNFISPKAGRGPTKTHQRKVERKRAAAKKAEGSKAVEDGRGSCAIIQMD